MKPSGKIPGPSQLVTQVAALPWRMQDCCPQVLLVTSRRSGHWMLPKGWQIDGMDLAASAQIEAFEEAGVLGMISRQPIGSYRYLKLLDNGRSLPSQALVFSLRVTSELDAWPEQRQRSRAWLGLDAAVARVQSPALARMLRQIRSFDQQMFTA